MSLPGYSHEALLASSIEDLVGGTAAWLRTGLEVGEDAVVIGDRGQGSALADAVGDFRVMVLDQADVYGKPVKTLGFMGDFVRDRVAAGSRRVRMVGAVDFGATAESGEDWQQYEAVCNAVLAELPLWSVCVYDTHRLSAPHVETAALTHPLLRSPTGMTTASPSYADPREVLAVRRVNTPAPTAAARYSITGSHQLAGLRAWLRQQLARHLPSGGGSREQRQDDFVLAVDEVATNALRHGRPPVHLGIRVDPDQLTCTVTDQGAGLTDPLVGWTVPNHPAASTSGRGLWLARHLCDRVTPVHAPEGFSIRLQLNR